MIARGRALPFGPDDDLNLLSMVEVSAGGGFSAAGVPGCHCTWDAIMPLHRV